MGIWLHTTSPLCGVLCPAIVSLLAVLVNWLFGRPIRDGWEAFVKSGPLAVYCRVAPGRGRLQGMIGS